MTIERTAVISALLGDQEIGCYGERRKPTPLTSVMEEEPLVASGLLHREC